MDKTTLKIIGTRLQRDYAVVDKLPYPLQRALAALGERERGQPTISLDGDDGFDPEPVPAVDSACNRQSGSGQS